MKQLKVLVIIVAYNQLKYLQKTIPILQSQKLPLNIMLEIIVIDSGSDDGTLEYLESLEIKILRIKQSEFHYATVFNQAFQLSPSDFVVRLSGDVIPLEENFLLHLLQPFSDLEVAASYGKYIILDQINKRLPYSWPAKRFPDHDQIYQIKPSKFLTKEILNPVLFEQLRNLAGGACMIRSSVFTARSFNKNIIEGEDAEYAVYLHHTGNKIAYCNKALVLHEHDKTSLSVKRIIEIGHIWLVLLIEFYRINIQTYYQRNLKEREITITM